MGITLSSAALLIKGKKDNICFDSILTIGHQRLFLSKKQIGKLAEHYDLSIDASASVEQEYADDFLRKILGAKTVMSLDYAEYEGCDIIHDMNLPVDPKYYEAFDVVIDGGSLEHIFNFPVAIANCMKMVKKGGSLFILSVTNNHTGHGFYQFSPELFYRIFREENGFEIRSVILEKHRFPGAELSPSSKCYSVADPFTLKKRVGLVSRSPVLIMVHAIRTEIKEVFANSPIQSDYTSLYQGGSDPAAAKTNPVSTGKKTAQKVYRLLPLRVKNFLNGKLQLRNYSFRNRQFYKRWQPF